MKQHSHIHIIGFAGRTGNGKSTAATMLSDTLYTKGCAVRRSAMAKQLKLAAALMLRVDLKWFTEPELKNKIIPGYTFSGRDFLQKVATEGMREGVAQDIFIQILDKEYEELKIVQTLNNAPLFFLLDDIRFENETHYIRNKRGIIIHLFAHFSDSRQLVATHSSHASEAGVQLLSQDKIIYNTSTLEFLKSQVDELAEVLMGMRTQDTTSPSSTETL
jgi:hypothetical protein